MIRRAMTGSGMLLLLTVALAHGQAATPAQPRAAKPATATPAPAKPSPRRTATAGHVPRTPWGDPDLQGVWDYWTFTPLERPAEIAGTGPVAEDVLRRVLQKEADKKVDGALNAGTGSYDREWYEYKEGQIYLRPSLIVDPPDGRLPAMTDWAKQKVALARDHGFDSYELMDPGDRCIGRGMLGTMLPTFYNNGKQIVQTPGHIAIFSEMIHDARVIPLGKQPHAPAGAKFLHGDGRAHWEGDTLVIESTNYSQRDVLRVIRVQSDALKVTERFKVVDGNSILYQMTIDDPKVYARPWTIEFPLVREADYKMFEYACHEGNHAIEGILRGARFNEKQGR